MGVVAREAVPMSLRREIVELDPKSMSMSVVEFCGRHNVSTWFFYDLRRRFAVDGEAALAAKSRAPKVVANRTGSDMEDEIVRARKELADQGYDCGSESIFDRLRDMGLAPPSSATIYRVLCRRGLIVAEPRKRPKRVVRRFTADRANECWQIDGTFVQLANRRWAEILNVIDDHSRLLVASVAVKNGTANNTFDVIVAASQRWGLPERLLSDNGPPFRAVAASLHALGVATTNSRPYHPQTCGKVERFHQTLKQRLAARPTPRSLVALQAELDVFADHYNHHRRHRGLDRRVPYDVWTTAPRSGPADRPLTTATTRVTRTTPTDGRVWIAKHTVISVGAAYNRREITAITTGDRVDLFADGDHIRSVTTQPDQTRYPLP